MNELLEQIHKSLDRLIKTQQEQTWVPQTKYVKI